MASPDQSPRPSSEADEISQLKIEILTTDPNALRMRAAERYAEGQIKFPAESAGRVEATLEANTLALLALMSQQQQWHSEEGIRRREMGQY